MLQVLQSTTSTQQSITSTTHADLTGLSVTITPASASSKFLIMYSIQFLIQSDSAINIKILRDSTIIVNVGGTTENYNASNDHRGRTVYQYLDAPSTTSAITYKLTAGRHYINTVYVNDNSDYQSSITVMEIAS